MPQRFEPEDWGRDESHLWDEISSDFRDDFGDTLENDRRAMALFDAGWIDDSLSRDARTAARDEFFDYVIEEGYFDDVDDFDWAAWREYMDY